MPTLIIAFVFIFCALPIFLFFLFLKQRKKKIQRENKPSTSNKTYDYISFDEVNKRRFNGDNFNQIEVEGSLLAKSEIDSIYLTHGTFIGDDPMEVISFIEKCFPKINSKIISGLRKRTKKLGDHFAKDLGNFTFKHSELLTKLTDEKIAIRHFSWSSANYHIARVRACFNLIAEIASQHQGQSRILLIGHSHAATLFSLMTTLINKPSFRLQLFKIIKLEKEEIKTLTIHLKKIEGFEFDFVTFGSPARYEWNLNEKMRVLHLINHRGSHFQGGFPLDSLTTKDGDYIQQWAVNGSDFKAISTSEKELNIKLDKILGIGRDLKVLKAQLKKRNRFHSEGHHLFIDYGDNAKLPNCLLTVFGHGVYTKMEHLNFHLYIINRYFYSN